MNKAKILIVDDSAFIRTSLRRILSEDSGIGEIHTANNGLECLEKIKSFNPDVVILDVDMPIMDGLTALKFIFQIDKSISVIMISSMYGTNSEEIIKALDIGAFDFIEKSNKLIVAESSGQKNNVIDKVKAAYKFRISSKESLEKNNKLKAVKKFEAFSKEDFSNLIFIGSSTGGPKALHQVITKLPRDINAAILVVQHMPAGFTKSLASRLNFESNITVKEAKEGDVLKRGICYLAPGGYHMEVVKNASGKLSIKLNSGPTVNGHKPSVEVMVDSLSKHHNYKKLGIMLTGMGSDGADSFKRLRDAGAFTIAQDESSCVVYGMPKAAKEKGGIDIESKLDDIHKIILEKIK